MSRILLVALLGGAMASGALRAQPAPRSIQPTLTVRLATGGLPDGFDRVRFYPDGAGRAAGDVNGDGRTDLLLTAEAVADVRTEALADVTGQSLLFFGPSTDLAPSQVLFDRLLPAGDLDGDGFADALTVPTDRGGEAVRWYRGAPGGYAEGGTVSDGAGAPLVLPALRGATAIGDLDGDGRSDLAVLDPDPISQRALTLALSRGAGRLDTLQIPLRGSWVAAFEFSIADLAIADLDGDGDGEVLLAAAVRQRGDPRLRVGRVDVAAGRATLTTVLDVPFGTGVGPGIAAVDLDGDGRLDLVVDERVFETQETLVFAGAVGGFDPVPYRTGLFVPAGDLDGDGAVDGVRLDREARPTAVASGPAAFAADRTVVFARERTLPPAGGLRAVVSVREVVVGDFDDDGRSELVAGARRGGPGALAADAFGRVILSVADRPTLSPVLYDGASFPAATVRAAAALGDLDGDGRDEIGVVFSPTAFASDPRVEIRRGGALDGPPLAVLRRTERGAALPVADVASGDVDGDGLRDVVVVYRNARTLDGTSVGGGASIWLGGDGFEGGPAWRYTCDLAAAAEAGVLCDTAMRDGRDGGVGSVAVSDLNADGFGDVALVALYGGTLAVLLGGPDLPDDSALPAGRTVLREGTAVSAGAYRVSAIGDVDADGYKDLLVCSPVDVTCTVRRGAAAGLAPGGRALRLSSGASTFPGQFVVAANVLGNGSPDLLLASVFDTAGVYEGGARFDGEPDRETGFVFDLGVARATPFSLFVGEITALPDLDGDGLAELLVADGARVGAAADAFVLQGGSFAPLARLVSPNPTVGLGVDNDDIYSTRYSAVGDLDGDGGVDVVLAQQDDANDAPEGSRLLVYSLADLGAPTRPAEEGLAFRIAPNPAVATVRAGFDLSAQAAVSLEAFDALGRRVAREARTLGPGLQWIALATDEWAAGVYVVRLRAGDETATRTVTVVR